MIGRPPEKQPLIDVSASTNQDPWKVNDELIQIIPSTDTEPSELRFKCCDRIEEMECCPAKGWCHRFFCCGLFDDETKRLNAFVGLMAGAYVLGQGIVHAVAPIWASSNQTSNQTNIDSANLASLNAMGTAATLAGGFYTVYTSFSGLFCRPPKDHQA